MNAQEFAAEISELDAAAPDSRWLDRLCWLYGVCSASQREELRRHIHWDKPWPEPSDKDWFTARWIERHGRLADPQHLQDDLVRIATRATTDSPDQRDDILAVGLIYHAAVLCGCDPDELFATAGSSCDLPGRGFLRDFIARSPASRSLEAFGLELERDPSGWIVLQPKQR